MEEAPKKTLRVAIVGCAHGALDEIYDTIEYMNTQGHRPVDLLLCCGDFQSIRNTNDMRCMACPVKYQTLGTFHKYYSGAKTAPIMTIFIGGNHEASNYLQELQYGGFVAPNIFYLGTTGVVNYGGVRIGGLSGIYKQHEYSCGHHEHYPYNESTKRSVYHVREYDVFQLSHIETAMDVFLSHDWPRGIAHYGDMNQLMRYKSFLRDEIMTNTLGNPAGEYLLHKIQPSFWFSAHLHVKFPAIVRHETRPENSEEKETHVDQSTQCVASSPPPSDTTHKQPKMTKFLALDKPLPNRDFLQVIEIDRPESEQGKDPKLRVDSEWCAILRATHHLTPTQKFPTVALPTDQLEITDEDRAWVDKTKGGVDRFEWPTEFVTTAAAHDETNPSAYIAQDRIGNPQTDAYLKYLGLPHMTTIPYQAPYEQQVHGVAVESLNVNDPNAIDIDVDVDIDEEEGHGHENEIKQDTQAVVLDENEIDIDDM